MSVDLSMLKILNYADLLGVKIAKRSRDLSYSWNGTNFAGYWFEVSPFNKQVLRVKMLAGMALIHELAHWYVASEEERKLPEFGLDQLFIEPGTTKHGIISKERQGQIEAAAVFHTYVMARHLDLFQQDTEKFFKNI